MDITHCLPVDENAAYREKEDLQRAQCKRLKDERDDAIVKYAIGEGMYDSVV